MNVKLLKGNTLTDGESDVLNFIVDMIQYNKIKQQELKGDDEDESETINSYTKLRHLIIKIR